MKTSKSIIIITLAITIVASCCTSTQEIETVPSLYKTEEGRAASYKSYDRALTLFSAPFTDDYVETDFGRTHLLVAGNDTARPLIIIPGLFGDASMWYANMG